MKLKLSMYIFVKAIKICKKGIINKKLVANYLNQNTLLEKEIATMKKLVFIEYIY